MHMQVQPGDWLLQQAQVIDQRGADQDQKVIAHEMTIAGNAGDCPVIKAQKKLPRHEGRGRGCYLIRWPGLAPLSGLSR